MMLVKETTKEAIDAKAATMSDFLKMEYFESSLKQNKEASFEIKKYANTQLANLYEGRSMYLEAARKMNSIADISTTFNEKRLAFLRVLDLCIKAGSYDRADDAFKKAMACANLKEKEDIKIQMKNWYKVHAAGYEKHLKHGNALKAYEKVYSLELNDNEKQETRQKLMQLYNRLGKIREYNAIKSTQTPAQQPSPTTGKNAY